jgi:hypothetical protein
VPSVRVNVVSMVAAALPPAVGAPVLVNGGQVVAQALVQADLVLVSSSNAYNARPDPSTRYTPTGPVVVATFAGPAADPDAAVDPDPADDRADPDAAVGDFALDTAANDQPSRRAPEPGFGL